jgi:hypothetical protein
LRTVHVTAIQQHRRTVGENEKSLFTASGLDEMDIQFTSFPSRVFHALSSEKNLVVILSAA